MVFWEKYSQSRKKIVTIFIVYDFDSLVFPVVDFCQRNHPVIRIVELPKFKNLHSKSHIILLNEDMLTNLIIGDIPAAVTISG